MEERDESRGERREDRGERGEEREEREEKGAREERRERRERTALRRESRSTQKERRSHPEPVLGRGGRWTDESHHEVSTRIECGETRAIATRCTR